MATYGTKKRGIFSKLSGFPDDKSRLPGNESSGYNRFEKIKSAMKGSWSRPVDECVDELASDTLLGDFSYRENSTSSEPGIQTRTSSTPEGLTLSEALNMPFPPVPQDTHSSNRDQHRSLPTRKPKLRRNGNKERVRPTISAPILQGAGPQIRTRPIISAPILQGAGPQIRTQPIISAPILQGAGPQIRTQPIISAPILQGAGPQIRTRPIISAPILQGAGPQIRTRPIISGPIAQAASLSQTSMLHDDATDEAVNQTLDMLIDRLRAFQEEDNSKAFQAENNSKAFQAEKTPQGVENAKTEKPSRLSPLLRGKAVLAKATRAIAVRMNHNGHNGVGRQAVADLEGGTPSTRNLLSSGSNVAEELPTFDRRIAEGINLGKGKVQTSVGDGYIKRKPVPGTEILRPPTPVSDDPLADEKIAFMLRLGTPDFSGFNFDFEPSGAQSNSIHDGSPGNSTIQRDFAPTEDFQEEPESRSSGFSDREDLAEVEAFSAIPMDLSSPLAGPSSSFSFSDNTSEKMALPAMAQHPDGLTFATSPIQRQSSLKRKSAIVELQSNRNTMKKIKRDSIVSYDLNEEEEAELITGIDGFDTGERQALRPKDKNKEIESRGKDSVNPEEAPKRGLAIFETSKGKERMIVEEDERPQLPQRRAAVYKRSGIPRPIANFYGSGMRARGAFDTSVDNPMDVDELHTSDRAYQVGTAW